MKILMVCLGNICRSPLAEGILKNKTNQKKNVIVDSAGTASYHIGSPPDKRSVNIAKQNGIDLSQQRARQNENAVCIAAYISRVRLIDNIIF